jgi:hypothetical protein
MRPLLAGAMLCLLLVGQARAWGPEGHAIVAEIAQRRLTASANAAVTKLLGPGVSLASVSMWADDVRESRPETYSWHFVNIPLADTAYNAALHCRPTPNGDCIVAELERLRNDVRCARSDAAKTDALRFAVHLVADIHQPFHTISEKRGGNLVPVTAYIAGATCAAACAPIPTMTNLHAVWDNTLVHKAAWDWRAVADLVEQALPQHLQRASTSNEPRDWALETHSVARRVWAATPTSGVIDDEYFRAMLPVVLQQLGRAGLRLARFLNGAYAAQSCPTSATR